MKQLQIVSQLVYDLATIAPTKYSPCCPCMRVDCLHACGPTPFAGVSHLNEYSIEYSIHQLPACDSGMQAVTLQHLQTL